MLKKEYEVMKCFVDRPWKGFTFRDVKKLSGKSSDSYVYNSLKGFVRENILVQESIGNVVLYSLNLDSLKAQSYAGFVAEYIASTKNHIPLRDIGRIAEKIPTAFYSLIITGSYVRGKQKGTSDVDLVIICDDMMSPKKVYAELRFECEKNIPQIHLYVFTKSEFLAMLLNNESNYGKEIVQNNIMISGGQEYYRIMAEAVQNGFNDKKIGRAGVL